MSTAVITSKKIPKTDRKRMRTLARQANQSIFNCLSLYNGGNLKNKAAFNKQLLILMRDYKDLFKLLQDMRANYDQDYVNIVMMNGKHLRTLVNLLDDYNYYFIDIVQALKSKDWVGLMDILHYEMITLNNEMSQFSLYMNCKQSQQIIGIGTELPAIAKVMLEIIQILVNEEIDTLAPERYDIHKLNEEINSWINTSEINTIKTIKER